MSNLLKWLMYVLFQEGEVVAGGSFALLAASFSNTCRMCSVKLWPTQEMKGIMWSGGCRVSIASCTCKTSWKSFSFFRELVASANGNKCRWDQRNRMVVEDFHIDQAWFLVPRALWDLRASPRVNPFPSSIPERVFFLFLCLQRPWVLGEEGSMLEADLLSLGSAGTIHLFATRLMKALHSLSLVYDGWCP